jgi:drug/metabolite transporter (DMT)-like permease
VGLAWGLAAAVVCALAYGAATVFQAIGAGRTKDTAGAGVDPRVLIRALSQLPFVAGLALDILGLVADLVALEKLPLFAVQAIMNCSLAVTALLAVPLLKAKLTRNDWVAVAAVVVGLILVGISAGPESPVHVGRNVHWGLLVAVAVLIAGSFLAIWKLGGNPVVLAAFAGSLFGAFAICVRILPDLRPTELLTDPAAYAGVVASITGFLFFTTALQRGSVTIATATLVVGETGLPALLGFTLFHDHTRQGFVPVAVVGFLCAVGGAVALSRFGEATPPPANAVSGQDQDVAASAESSATS